MVVQVLVHLFFFCILSLRVFGRDIQRPVNTLVSNDAINELLEWRAPEKIIKEFPFFLSGYDYEDRPVLVLEYGKWNTRRIADENGNDLRDVERRHEQLIERLKSGYFNKVTTDAEVNDFAMIIDYDGLEISQISPANVNYFLNQTSKWQECYENLAYGFIVNANAVAEEILIVATPFWANMMERIEIYGTNSHKFIPEILKYIPREQLPEAYGGHPEFRPVALYG